MSAKENKQGFVNFLQALNHHNFATILENLRRKLEYLKTAINAGFSDCSKINLRAVLLHIIPIAFYSTL